MHHFHPPAPKSCTANQQLNSLMACQYLPCGSVAIRNEKEGLEMLHIGAYVTSVRVAAFSAFIHRRDDPPSYDRQISYVVISFCELQGPAFPYCLQLSEGACCALRLAKAGFLLNGVVSDHGSSLSVCHRSRLEQPSLDTAQCVWHLCITMCSATGVVVNALFLQMVQTPERRSLWGEVGPQSGSVSFHPLKVINGGELSFSSASNRVRGGEKARP